MNVGRILSLVLRLFNSFERLLDKMAAEFQVVATLISDVV
jgi:hypothetical protein